MNRLTPILAAILLAFLAPERGMPQAAFDQEKCSLCHVRESVFFNPSFLTPETLKEFDEERLCDSCHNGSVQDSRAELWRGAQHPAPSGPKGKGLRCTSCHSPHGKGGWTVLAGSGVPLRKGGSAVCAGCHPSQNEKGGALHGGRIGEGGCRECHIAHGGSGKALLRETGSSLCLRCHAKLDPAKAGGHPLAVPGEDRKETRPLPGCLGCHPVHRSADPASASTVQCVSCHPFTAGKGAAGGISHKEEKNCSLCHTFHARSGDGGRAFRGKELRPEVLCRKCHPTYWAGDKREGRAEGTHVTLPSEGGKEICTRCHRLHEAPSGTPLLRSPKTYFCLDCHEGQNTIREDGGIVLAHPVFEKVAKGRLSDVVREKGLAVGTTGEIVCRTCHKMHGAQKSTALLATGGEQAESCFWCHPGMRGMGHTGVPTGIVADCLGCHPVHGRKVSGGDPWRNLCQTCHPRRSAHLPGSEDRGIERSRELPEFDPRGRRNLYGNVSCPTCHVPHGASAETHRLRKNYTPNGILCTSCHRKEEAVALTPHDLRGISGNGICEPCHQPHNASPPWMWGLPRGEGERGEDACRGCHRERGIASAVPRGGHPVNLVVPRPLPEEFPLFGPEGESSRNGVFTCPTCHEVHGTGILPTGGRGTGKLLRVRRGGEGGDGNDAEVCAACHAGKSLRHVAAKCVACHPPHTDGDPSTQCRKCHPGIAGTLAAKHSGSAKECVSCHRLHPGGGRGEKTDAGFCADCHSSEQKIIGSPHSSLGKGACEACHPVHKEKEATEYKRKLGEDLFTPDLPCYRCHREGGIGPLPQRPSHPNRSQEVATSYGATVKLETPIQMVGRYKEGNKPVFPLFDDDGRPGMNGRVGCLTCHDPHAGAPKEKDGEGVVYLRDPTFHFLAEICSGCHREDGLARARTFHEYPAGKP